MDTITSNLNAILPFFVSIWIVLIVLSVWKPYRFKNAFILMMALVITMMTIAAFCGDRMGEALLGFVLLIGAALMAVPVLLIANGINVMRREGVSKANMLSLALGIVIAIGEIIWLITILTGVYNRLDRAAFGCLFLVFETIFYISFIILAFVLYNLFIQYIPKLVNYDYVIIHGCGLLNGRDVSPLLASRIDKAISVYKTSKDKPIIMPSGGRGSDESISEAQAMKDYLLGKGIPEDKILMEDQSTTTMENLKNCKTIIERLEHTRRPRIALVSSNYHVYRCMLYSMELKMKCIGIGAKTAWYYWPTALLREFVAIFTRPKYVTWTAIGYVFLVLLPSRLIFF